MTKNHDRKWAFRPGQARDAVLWAVHDGKNHGRSEGEENIGEFPVMVGGRGRVMHGGLRVFSHIRTRVCASIGF